MRKFWTKHNFRISPLIWCSNNVLALTSDLRQMFIDGQFDTENLTPLAHHLKIPRFLMFMNSPGPNFGVLWQSLEHASFQFEHRARIASTLDSLDRASSTDIEHFLLILRFIPSTQVLQLAPAFARVEFK
ncbi:hypothetical protein BDR07DRAFT_922842 [Suillus spraguei]|nr:hypothetical protein BDR07DRAFT_922842 [Suillus spraguei]